MAVDPVLPRAARKGPPITLTCECGEKRELRYGESWRCESCGRSFDTRRIPLEASPSTAHLFIVAPLLGSGGIASLFSTHPPIKDRIRRLIGREFV